MRLVSASANPDKVAEMAAILRPHGIELVPRPAHVDDVVEDAETLEENARLKAVAVSAGAEGEVVVADDTGLEVDALGGAPGVLSARFAGEDATYADNVVKLLDALVELPDLDQRTARFHTVALARFPDGREVVTSGAVEGVITPAPRGTGGFGYDQVFQPDEGDGRTFAEMSPEEKHALSHRGRAFRALAERLASLTSP
jgi:XTP/dITP diphosphohydrolase